MKATKALLLTLATALTLTGCSLSHRMTHGDGHSQQEAVVEYQALSAAEQLIIQNELAEIAKTDEDFRVRQAAVEKVTNLDFLVNLAEYSTFSDVRNRALNKITDQAVIIKIAKNAKNSDARVDAVNKIKDKKVLQFIADNDSCYRLWRLESETEWQRDYPVREAAIKRIKEVDKSLVESRDTPQEELFKIAKESKEWSIRKAAVEKLTDQSMLAEIVKNGDWITTQYPTLNFNDQTLLKRLLEKEEDSQFREVIIANLTDQEVLSELLINEVVIKRITDQNVLAKIAMIGITREHESILAVERMTDPTLLKKIASDQKAYFKVRKIAISKIRDQSLIAKLAKEDPNSIIRNKAIKQLIDQDILRHIVENDPEDYVRATAVERIDDIDYLTQILAREGEDVYVRLAADKRRDELRKYSWVKTTSSYYSSEETTVPPLQPETFDFASEIWNFDIRAFALSKLTGQSELLDVINNANNVTYSNKAKQKLIDIQTAIIRNPQTSQQELLRLTKEGFLLDTRKAAAEKLTDQAALAEVAKNATDWPIRQIVVKKLTSQELLATIAKTDAVWEVARTATEKLTDQKTLTEIAKTNKHANVRITATNKLVDSAVLATIAQEDKSWDVRRVATVKLTDQVVLTKIAKSDPVWEVREVAVEKLTDPSTLVEIITTDTVLRVCEVAMTKLVDQKHILHVATISKSQTIKCAAIKKITTLDALVPLLETSDPTVQDVLITQFHTLLMASSAETVQQFKHTIQSQWSNVLLAVTLDRATLQEQLAGQSGHQQILHAKKEVMKRFLAITTDEDLTTLFGQISREQKLLFLASICSNKIANERMSTPIGHAIRIENETIVQNIPAKTDVLRLFKTSLHEMLFLQSQQKVNVTVSAPNTFVWGSTTNQQPIADFVGIQISDINQALRQNGYSSLDTIDNSFERDQAVREFQAKMRQRERDLDEETNSKFALAESMYLQIFMTEGELAADVFLEGFKYGLNNRINAVKAEIKEETEAFYAELPTKFPTYFTLDNQDFVVTIYLNENKTQIKYVQLKKKR